MNSQIIDTLFMGPKGLEKNKGFRVKDGYGAISSGGEEITREGEVWRAVEREGSDGGGEVVKRTEGSGG